MYIVINNRRDHNPFSISVFLEPFWSTDTVTSSSISIENLAHLVLVSRMFLHEGEENQQLQLAKMWIIRKSKKKKI